MSRLSSAEVMCRGYCLLVRLYLLWGKNGAQAAMGILASGFIPAAGVFSFAHVAFG